MKSSVWLEFFSSEKALYQKAEPLKSYLERFRALTQTDASSHVGEEFSTENGFERNRTMRENSRMRPFHDEKDFILR